MTTPHQGPASRIEKLLGQGAYQIGSGSGGFGQHISNDIAEFLIAGPGAALGGVGTELIHFVEGLAKFLRTLPLEALHWVRKFIPGALLEVWNTVDHAVERIMHFISVNVLMGAREFEHWIQEAYNFLQREVHQIFDAIEGFIVTPISSRVAGFVDWLAAVPEAARTDIQTIENGIFNAVHNASTVINQTAASVESHLRGAFLGLFNAHRPGAPVTSASAADVASVISDQVTTVSGQTVSIGSINAQLPSFYGGGTGGLSESVMFSGSLPAGFTVKSTIAANSAQFDTAATTDTQTVSGSFSSSDGYAKYLFLRGNSAWTSYTYAKIQNNTPFTGTHQCEICCVVSGVKTVLDTFTLPGSGTVVAGAAYVFEAVDYALTLTGPGGLDHTFTDGSHVSQKGSSFRLGGFGLDGFARQIDYYSGTGSLPYTVPAFMGTGDKFCFVAVGAGQGAGSVSFGGVGGSWNSATPVYGPDIPLSTTSFTVTVGAKGVMNGAGGGVGGDGGASSVAATGYTTLTASGGTGGSATSSGKSPGNYTSENTGYTGGAVATGFQVANPPGGGGNAIPADGSGAPGAVWVVANDMQVPGSFNSFAFYDSAVAGPATALVATAETTTSTTYADLTTITDQVTVNVGPSGTVQVFLSAEITLANNGGRGFVGFALSGANTQAANDNMCIQDTNSGSVTNVSSLGAPFLLEGLAEGATTFKMKHRTNNAGFPASFQYRRISVTPL